MAYKKLADLTDNELDLQITAEKQGIEAKQICSPRHLNNLLDERIRRSHFKIVVLAAQLNQIKR